MKPNMGTADRAVRTLIAAGIALLYYIGWISGVVAIILGVLAAVFVLTSLTARCPGYLPLGVSTRKEPPTAAG